jgi:hypothetical protein
MRKTSLVAELELVGKVVGGHHLPVTHQCIAHAAADPTVAAQGLIPVETTGYRTSRVGKLNILDMCCPAGIHATSVLQDKSLSIASYSYAGCWCTYDSHASSRLLSSVYVGHSDQSDMATRQCTCWSSDNRRYM